MTHSPQLVPGKRTAPVALLIETDIFSDVDDVGALAVAHAFADDGLAVIAGVCVNTPSRWGHQAVRVVNSYYGRPEIPVGALLPLDDSVADRDYAKTLATMFLSGDQLEPPASAVSTLRTVLDEAEDGSIVLVSLGFFGNLTALLASGPDGISPELGTDLVRRKVKRTVVMGGRFPSGWEFNLGRFPSESASFLESWPGEIEFLGWEVGSDVVTGASLSPAADPANPAALAYATFNGPGVGRASWDLMTVALAVCGVGDDYEYSPRGRVVVRDDGQTEWTVDPEGSHRYVTRVAPIETIQRALDHYLDRIPTSRRVSSRALGEEISS